MIWVNERREKKPKIGKGPAWDRTILLVNDDAALRDVMRKALRDNYRILDARTGPMPCAWPRSTCRT